MVELSTISADMSPPPFPLSELFNGHLIPQIHLGLYKMSGPQVTQAVSWALKAGYRGFDSAQAYKNEKKTGAAIREFLSAYNNEGVQREDIFYTSKLARCSTYYDAVRISITKSVKECGLGYIDLFLLHSPDGGCKARLTSWVALEDAILAGQIRSGGVSNYEAIQVRFAIFCSHRGPAKPYLPLNPFPDA